MLKYGPIINNETGETKDITVRFISKNSFKDVLVGGGIILLGVIYLTRTTFKNGANAYENAEFETLESLGLFRK